jgi:ankyrin repeat protein
LDKKNKEGHTPLHLACLKNSAVMVQRLVSAGCNVNAKDNEGNTAIHLASLSGFSEVTAALLTTGKCDLEIKNSNKETPLILALKPTQNNRVDCAVMLIKGKQNDVKFTRRSEIL